MKEMISALKNTVQHMRPYPPGNMVSTAFFQGRKCLHLKQKARVNGDRLDKERDSAQATVNTEDRMYEKYNKED